QGHGAIDVGLEGVRITRLGQLAVSDPQPAQRTDLSNLAAEDDPYRLGMALPHLAEELVAIHLRHAHIGDNNLRWLAGQFGQSLFATGGETHAPLVAQGPQHPLQPLQEQRLVVYKQDSRQHVALCAAHHSPPSPARGNRTMNVVPTPTSLSKLT